MKRIGLFLFLVTGYWLLVTGVYAQEETFTLTTYYPAPYGAYKNLYASDKVGIGTTNPSTDLEIKKLTSPSFSIQKDGAENWRWTATDVDFQLYEGNTQRLIIRDTATGSGDIRFINFGKLEVGSYFKVTSDGGVTAGDVTAKTLDTGKGANELYKMDQDVLKSSDVTFNNLYPSGNIYLADGKTVDGYDIGYYGPYFIGSAGTSGYVWTSDGAGRGVWTVPTAVAETKIRDKTPATNPYLTGNIDLAEGANVTLTQSGQTITIASTAGGGGGVQGSGTAGRIPKFITNNQIGDSVIYESAGNVGIGTTSPGSSKLKVTGGVYTIYAEGGTTAAGYFQESGINSYAMLGSGSFGVRGHGNSGGGLFKDKNNSGEAYVGYGDYGIEAHGNSGGGYFKDTNSSGYAFVGYGDYGIQAYGNTMGGYFKDSDSSGYARVGYGDYGITAYGSTMGGYFADSDSSGYTRVGYGDYGIQAYGSTMGGYFADTNGTARIYLAYGDYGIDQIVGTKNYFAGNVGIGINNPTAKLHVNGNIKAVLSSGIPGSLMKYNTSTKEIGYDIAELFETNGEVEPGDVLVIDSDGKLKKSDTEYDKKVAGVVSSAPAILFEGGELQIAPEPFKFQKGTKPPVTLAGKVSMKVTTENGTIEPGDLLTTSSTPGHAMKAKPIGEINGYPIYPQGCIMGKALEPLKEGKGKILVLVCLM